MKMIRKKVKKTITKSSKLTDDIVTLYTAPKLQDPESNSEDETQATVAEFDEDFDDENDDIQQLSEFRKKNLVLLGDVDKKYRGSAVSRKEMLDTEDSDDDEDLNEESDNSSSSGDDNQLQESENDDDLDEESEAGSENDGDSDVGSEEESETQSHSEDENENGSENEEETTDLFPKSSETNSQKGLAVQNQLKVWEKLLEMRIHSQKILTSANSLPSAKLFEKLTSDNEYDSEAKRTMDNVGNLVDKMVELQNILVSRFDETKKLKLQPSSWRKRKHSIDEDDNEQDGESDPTAKVSAALTHNYETYRPYSNSVIQKWYDRTKLFTSTTAKESKHTDYGILRRIEGVMANKKDIIRKSQIVRGGYELFRPEFDECVELCEKSSKTREVQDNEAMDDDAEAVPNVNGALEKETFCTEIYDDTDFYHQLLRELIEFKTAANNPVEIKKQLAELEKLRKKMKKTVDTRASKGRKTRYVVHKKLVNFMAPNGISDWTGESKDELFNSLFGKSDKSI